MNSSRWLRWAVLPTSLAVLALASSVATAPAAVTIGQVAPDTAPSACNFVPVDRLQPTVTSGNSYVVPAIPPATLLVISSWSFNATGTAAGQMMTMKVFRKIGEPRTYQAVGHDGPHPITGGTLNTFSSNVPVSPGDVLGTNQPTSAPTTCLFLVSGETSLFEMSRGNLADGESTSFDAFPNQRVNVSAVVAPSNSFAVGKVGRNQKKGTALLAVTVPNPGELAASGRGVRAAARAVTSKSVAAGQAQLVIRAKGKQKRKLNAVGKVKLKVTVTYTPTGGDPNTQSVKVKLKKKP
jgi:hypothetical protein